MAAKARKKALKKTKTGKSLAAAKVNFLGILNACNCDKYRLTHAVRFLFIKLIFPAHCGLCQVSVMFMETV